MKSASSTAIQGKRLALILCILFIFFGAVLRFATLFDDFWSDEIWSWEFARQTSSPWEILTTIHHDNNHILNTFFLYFLGDQTNWIIYRLPSLLFGIGSIVLATFIAFRRSMFDACLASFFFSFSTILIQLSAEARGYSGALFFSLLSFLLVIYAQEEQELEPERWRPFLFFLSSALGFLSHMTFLAIYIGFLYWMAATFSRKRLLKWHYAPLLFLTFLIIVDTLHIEMQYKEPGNYGPYYVRSTLNTPFGMPDTALGLSLSIPLLVAVLSLGLRRNTHEWGEQRFFNVVLLIPALLLFAYLFGPFVWLPRYALLSIAFLFLLMSRVGVIWWDRGLMGKFVSVALLFTFLLGNSWKTMELLAIGRGRYLDALTYMKQETLDREITVSSNYDQVTAPVLRFYERFLEGEKYVRYIPLREAFEKPARPKGRSDESHTPPEWFVVNAKYPAPDSAQILETVPGIHYILLKQFPSIMEAGFRWHVYRLAHPADEPIGRAPV